MVQTGQPLVGALIFPVGLILIVLLGLDLVTGSFGLLPLPWLENDAQRADMLANWSYVFIGNLIGSVAYGALLAIALTNFGTAAPAGVAAKIIAIAEAKTIGYAAHRLRRHDHRLRQGDAVQLDGLPRHRRGHDHRRRPSARSPAAYMPVFIFFAQGFEHSVVNMFVIPTGMMMGAKVTVAEWWLWNQIPVTLGNLVGGFIFTGLALYITHKPRAAAPAPLDRADAGAGGMTTDAGHHAQAAAKRRPATSNPSRSAIWKASSPACRSPRRRKASAAPAAGAAAAGCARADRARRRRAARRRTACSRPAASCPIRRSSSAKSIRSTPTSG